MKICSYCGHENSDAATTCGECAWAIPQVSRLQKAGRWLKVVAVVCVALSFAGCIAISFASGVPESSELEVGSVRSLLFLVSGGGIAAVLYWLGDYLRRNY